MIMYILPKVSRCPCEFYTLITNVNGGSRGWRGRGLLLCQPFFFHRACLSHPPLRFTDSFLHTSRQ